MTQVIALDRNSKKVTQFVRNYEECDEQVLNEMKSQDYRIEVKEDGVFGHFPIIDGKIDNAFSRTGNQFVYLEGLCENVENAFAFNRDVMLMGEICNDLCSLEELGAMFKSSRKKPLSDKELEIHQHTYFKAFDIVDLEEFEAGISETPSLQRRQDLESGYDTRFAMSTDSRTYLSTVIAWKVDADDKVIQQIAKNEIEAGQEGIVGKANFANWVAGRKNFLNFKIVAGYDIELKCIDFEMGKEGTKREGMVNKLIFQWKPFADPAQEYTTLCIDGRATDEMRIDWGLNPDKILNTIFHIHGLCMGSKGSIRLAKFREQRIDKDHADI